MALLIKYKAGYKFQLAKDYSVTITIKGRTIESKYIELKRTGKLTILAGYAWDGASGAIDTKTILRGSLTHDALFQLLRVEALPSTYIDEVNYIFKRICREDGMSRIRAWYVWWAVSRLGGRSAHPDQKKSVLSAP